MNSVQKITDEYYIDTAARIGQGSYGVIFKGYMKSQDKIIAVKFMNKKIMQQNPQYQRELEVMQELAIINHPNIMGYYGYGQKSDGIYLFIQYCKEGNLSNLIQSEISQLKIMTLFQQLLDAMTYINKLNKVHRDLKPDNILLDEHMNLKLADFGLARQIDRYMTKGACTPLYAAPQVFKFEDYDQKCDVWSAGIILYQMLMRVQLFGNISTKTELIKQFDSFKDGKRRIQYPKQLNRYWTVITEKMLIYDKNKRPAFKQMLQYFRSIKQQMLNDLNKKYDTNIELEQECVKSKIRLKRVNPYIRQQSKVQPNPNDKLNCEKSFQKIMNAQRHLTFLKLKNDLLNKLTRVFSSTSMSWIKNIYKYIMIFLSLSIYISRISETLLSLKKDQIYTVDECITKFNLQDMYKSSWQLMAKQFRQKQIESIQKCRHVLQSKVISKINGVYLKRQEQKKIIQSTKNLLSYIKDAQGGIFVKSKNYLALFTQVMNIKQNMLNPKQLLKISQKDARAYCLVRLIGNIDSFLPNSMYKNQDSVRVKNQQLQNMDRTQLINFIGKYNTK